MKGEQEVERLDLVAVFTVGVEGPDQANRVGVVAPQRLAARPAEAGVIGLVHLIRMAVQGRRDDAMP
jgi:hypothetical protein